MSKDRKGYDLALKRDKHRCIICEHNVVELHHIVFRSHGGNNDERNIVCLCRKHHEQAHNDEKHWREFFIERHKGIYGDFAIRDLKYNKWKNFKFNK